LWVPEEVDLIVRSGGAETLSQFLPLQAAYARMAFLPSLFNDLTVGRVLDVVTEHERLTLLHGE